MLSRDYEQLECVWHRFCFGTIFASPALPGVTHIVEEGRFGGLSAYMYALHGFDVTSIEFLPLESVSLPYPIPPYTCHTSHSHRVLAVSHTRPHT